MPARNRDTGTYGPAHRARARELKAAMQDGDPCCRCGQPMYRDQLAWIHADHYRTPRVHQPDGLPDALSHARCNLRHGAQLGNAMRGARRHTPRPALPQW